MSEITKELERRIEAGFMVEPQDVRRMLKHNDDMGRSFSQWLYAYMDMSQLQEILYQHYQLCLGGKVDLATMKAVAGAAMNTVASSARSNKMEDVMSVLYRSASALNACKDLDELADLIRKVQRFINMMFYAIDLAFPWSEVSKAYNEIRKDFVPPHREGVVDVCDL